MQKEVNLDINTLKLLLKEAEKNYKYAKKQFHKYDNCEDMHDMENWQSVCSWLKNKL